MSRASDGLPAERKSLFPIASVLLCVQACQLPFAPSAHTMCAGDSYPAVFKLQNFLMNSIFGPVCIASL